MKKKLLFITHSSDFVGGAEDEFGRLLKYFSRFKEKYAVEAMFPVGPRAEIYSSYCSRWAIIKRGFLPVIYDRFFNYVRFLFSFFIQFYQIVKFTWNREYDLCAINVVVLLWPVLIMNLKKTKIIVFVREDIYPVWLRHIVYKFLSRRCKFLISNSKTKKLDIKKTTLFTNIIYIYPAVEDDLINESNDFKSILDANSLDKLLDKEVFKFINLGSVYNRKNQKLIIKALNIIKKDNGICPYVFFAGSLNDNEQYVVEVKNMILELNLYDYCIFLGSLKREEYLRIIRFMDALIISSLSEGLPISLVESFKFKKPVIATKVGGIPEIINNMENGILIDFDEHELADSMSIIMENKTLYDKIAYNAYKTYLEKFNLDKALKKTEDIFLQVMDNESRSL